MSKSGNQPMHPGEVLRNQLEKISMSANALAQALDVPGNRVTAILRGQRGITADTALRLSRYFSTTPEYWMNLQQAYELRTTEIQNGNEIARKVKPRAAA